MTSYRPDAGAPGGQATPADCTPALTYCFGVAEETEGEAERVRRRYQRGLFDGAARLYQATRPGYPRELAGFVAATAGAGAGTPVLEVGCGTGQLTERLMPFGFALTAIDIGASMIEVARERVAGDGIAEVGRTLGSSVTMARVAAAVFGA